jgi:hypothetical protein
MRIRRVIVVLLMVGASLAVASPAHADFTASCTFMDGGGVKPCLGVKGSGLRVDQVNVGGAFAENYYGTDPSSYPGIVYLCQFKPGASITWSNCYKWIETPQHSFPKSWWPAATGGIDGPPHWYNWTGGAYAWSTSRGNALAWITPLVFQNGTRLCVRTKYYLGGAWRWSPYRCATIHS